MAASCLTAVLVLGLLGGALGKVGFGDGGQEYGYVDVRTGAHMFYWLFYVNGGESAAGKPLVIWFQGGPGASSSSYGNFEEIGPLDAFLKKRNSTWVNHVNVLFIDNPVGTGYSYVDNNGLLTTTNQQIAEDLVAFTKSFMTMYPAFQKLPLYIFCESYGGKMTAEFALNLYKEQTAGRVASNLKGIALGDSWISPIDSVMTWAPYLLHTGMVDKQGYDKIMDSAIATKNAVDRGLWSDATSLWSRTEYVIMDVAADVDFYNILTPISSYWRSGRDNSKGKGIEDRFLRTMVGRDSGVDLNSLMDRYVKPALGVIPANVKHTFSSSTVFNTLRGDFMKPVTNVVEQLLNDTDIEVNVLTGQLDLIVDTPGTLMWAEQLHWKLGDFWVNQVPRELLVVDGIIEGYVKGTSKFIFYWVNRAGHMIPSDNPAATIEILKRVTRLK